MYTPAIKFENDILKIIDQTRLPGNLQYLTLNTLEDSIEAIKKLKVRGAPAIGIVAAYTMYLIAKNTIEKSVDDLTQVMDQAAKLLGNARPTAVNLSWSINRIRSVYLENKLASVPSIINKIKMEAIRIHEEDRNACQKMAEYGLSVIANPSNILTHCNTGSLATGGWGTALGVVYAAQKQGYKIKVFVDETRPLGQGGRLTFWELMQSKIPCTLITDSTAGSLMQSGNIDLVIFGADRIAANGDVANKIGTYTISALALHHKIPCYTVAPTSTFDLSLNCGKDIPIEERSPEEILHIYGYNFNLPKNAKVYNPAFDVTPANYLTGIITEAGIIYKPTKEKIFKTIIPFIKEKK